MTTLISKKKTVKWLVCSECNKKVNGLINERCERCNHLTPKTLSEELIKEFEKEFHELWLCVPRFDHRGSSSHRWEKRLIDLVATAFQKVQEAERDKRDKVCKGHCKCPDCHVLADKYGNIPVPKQQTAKR